MFRIIICSLIVLFALVSGQSNVTTIAPSNTTTVPTTTTTIATNGTTEPTNETTTVRTTVSTKASTTQSVITTTPMPTIPPIPAPKEWNGNVTHGNNTCINVQFSVQIKVRYNNTNGTEVTTGFNIPVDAVVDEKNSLCASKTPDVEVIVINFINNGNTSANLRLTFNKSDDKVMVEEIKLTYILTKELFPAFHDQSKYNKEVVMEKSGLSLFSVSTAHSYGCESVQIAKLDDTNASTNGAEIEFTNSKVEAYIDIAKNGVLDSEINCKTTEISDVVPIAVGAALAGLVVIVLIAYFVGRRRSRRLAYQSV